MKKIVFLILNPGIGGHFRSAITIAQGLEKRGSIVWIIVPESKRSKNILMKYNFKRVKFLPFLSKSIIWDFYSIIVLFKFVKVMKIDMLHSFDLHSYIVSYFIKRLTKIPSISTICGGTLRFHYPYTYPVIVFSHELKNIMINKLGFKSEDIIVECARMELSEKVKHIDREQILKYLGTKNTKKIIMMVSRVSEDKVKSILYAIQAVDMLAKKREDFIFIHIGATQNNYIKEKITRKVEEINKKYNRLLIVTSELFSFRAVNALQIADIVLGVGRVCFEGMRLRKPVIIMGEYGYAGLISPETSFQTIEKITFYNFSGRNVQDDRKLDKRNDNMVLILNRLLSDREFKDECIYLGEKLIHNYDVRLAAKTYDNLYESLLNNKKQKSDHLGYILEGYSILMGRFMKGCFRTLIYNFTQKVKKIF